MKVQEDVKNHELQSFCAAHKHSKLRLQHKVCLDFHTVLQNEKSNVCLQLWKYANNQPDTARSAYLFKKNKFPTKKGLQHLSSTVPATAPHGINTQEDRYTPQVYDSVYWMKWDRVYVFKYIRKWKLQAHPMFTTP